MKESGHGIDVGKDLLDIAIIELERHGVVLAWNSRQRVVRRKSFQAYRSDRIAEHRRALFDGSRHSAIPTASVPTSGLDSAP